LRSILPLLVILLLGVALRIFYLVEIHDSPDFTRPLLDAAYHDYWARGIALGDWTLPRGVPSPRITSTPFFRPPGYPYFLGLLYSITSGSHTGTKIIQMLFGLLNVCLAFQLCRRLFDRRSGLILAFFMATYWIFIFYEAELLAPTLLVTLSLSFLLLLQSWFVKGGFPRAFLSGIVLGLMALTSPNYLVGIPLVFVWLLFLYRCGKSAQKIQAKDSKLFDIMSCLKHLSHRPLAARYLAPHYQ